MALGTEAIRARDASRASDGPGGRPADAEGDRPSDLPSWAAYVAEAELAATLPRRWAHTQGVAAQAVRVGDGLGLRGEFGRPGPDHDVPISHADVLTAAAWLHDVGYAPRLALTGFHPLDGARHLRDAHAADDLVVRLVANHSCALLEAELRSLRAPLAAEFALPDPPHLVDALIYCDMTTTPDGTVTTAEARIAEITSRYGPDSLVGHFIERAAPELLAAVARVEKRLTDRPR